MRGKRFKEAREDWLRRNPDRTSIELIAQLGITQQAYYKWESGKTNQISAGPLLTFARITTWNPLYLLYNERPKKLLDDSRLEAIFEALRDLNDTNIERVREYVEDRKARQDQQNEPPAD